MPPEASSPSRTYFPKTWGNMLGVCLPLLQLWGASACSPGPDVNVRPILAHWSPECNPDPGESPDRFTLRALGDFEPSNESVLFRPGTDRAVRIDLPDDTQAISIESVGGDPHGGFADPGEQASFNVLLWPLDAACALNGGSEEPGEGLALGISNETHTLLVAGGSASDQRQRGVAVHLRDGSTTQARMIRRRQFATITAYGNRLLVAGGQDGDDPREDADVFDPVSGEFLGPPTSPLPLLNARSHHAAVVLESGATLLIGGRGSDSQVLDTLEWIPPPSDIGDSPEEPSMSRIAPRTDPFAVRLSNGQILIAGGARTQSDGGLVPQSVVEWLSPDASSVVRRIDLVDVPPALGRVFYPTPNGLLLAGGCHLDGSPSRSSFWLDFEGRLRPLPNLPSNADDCSPVLVPASGGAPLLLANDLWFRLDPWTGRFEPIARPAAAPDGAIQQALNVDPGALVFVTDRGQLFGVRQGTRNRFSPDTTPFLLADPTRILPEPLGTENETRRDDGTVLSGSEARLWVTDTTYTDLSLTIDWESGNPPAVWLGEERVGANDCPWPISEPPTLLELIRRDTELSLRAGGDTTTCSRSLPQRISLGLAAPESGQAVLSSFAVRRLR